MSQPSFRFDDPDAPFAARLPKYSLGAPAASPQAAIQPAQQKTAEQVAATGKPMQRKSRAIRITFALFEPDARTVSVCGDFNDWEPGATPMKRTEDGQWQATVALRPGRYQYKFVVDEEDWISDPNASDNVPNEHGSFNSVVEVFVKPG